MREVEMLQRRDVDQKIVFVDIAAPDYSPEGNGGVSFEQASGCQLPLRSPGPGLLPVVRSC